MLEFLLIGILDQKYIQLFLKNLQQKQLQICKQVVKNNKIDFFLTKMIQNKEYAYLDLILEIFYNIKHSRTYYTMMIGQMDKELSLKFFQLFLDSFAVHKAQKPKLDFYEEYFGDRVRLQKILNLVFIFFCQNPNCSVDFWLGSGRRTENLKKMLYLHFLIEQVGGNFITMQILTEILSQLVNQSYE